MGHLRREGPDEGAMVVDVSTVTIEERPAPRARMNGDKDEEAF